MDAHKKSLDERLMQGILDLQAEIREQYRMIGKLARILEEHQEQLKVMRTFIKDVACSGSKSKDMSRMN